MQKDKASVLTTARDYLTSLKAQVDELSKRNQQLEAAARLIAKEDQEEEAACSSSTERVTVTLTHVSGSSTDQDQQIIALQVIVRSGECSTEDMVIRILEFLKQVKNLSLMSMKASTWKTELHPNINRVVLRLRVDDQVYMQSQLLNRLIKQIMQSKCSLIPFISRKVHQIKLQQS